MAFLNLSALSTIRWFPEKLCYMFMYFILHCWQYLDMGVHPQEGGVDRQDRLRDPRDSNVCTSCVWCKQLKFRQISRLKSCCYDALKKYYNNIDIQRSHSKQGWEKTRFFYSRPYGVCRYGRLLYFARVFLFLYLMRNLWNGRKYFGAKYGTTKDLTGKELSVSFTDIRPGVFPGGPKNWAKSTRFRT